MFAAVNRGFLKNSRFSIGWSLRRSQTTKVTSTTAEIANEVRISGSLQPFDGASMIP